MTAPYDMLFKDRGKTYKSLMFPEALPKRSVEGWVWAKRLLQLWPETIPGSDITSWDIMDWPYGDE